MSLRVKQIESILLRAISQVLSQQLTDPRVAGMVSVTQVTTASNLSRAKVGVSVLPKRRTGVALHALRKAAPRIRRLVGEAVTLRRVPILEFELDESLQREAAVLQDIEKGMQRESARMQSKLSQPASDEVSTLPPATSTQPEDQSA
jgi:ribosome-binding factor A